MVSFDTPIILFPLVLLSLAILWVRANRNARNLPLPPGPRAFPIVGSFFDIPRASPWLTYQSLCEKYGDIVHVRVMGKSIIIAGTPEVAMELLEKRSANYSDRPTSAAIPLFGCEWVVGLLPYGQRWRRARQILHQYFNHRMVQNYREIQTQDTVRFLQDLLADSTRFEYHLRFALVRSLTKILYGFKPDDDKYLSLVEKATESTEELVSGTFLVDFVPFMKYLPSWFPGAGFQKRFAKWRAASVNARDIPFDTGKEAFNAGTASSCVETALLEKISGNSDKSAIDEEKIARGALSSAHTGADTYFEPDDFSSDIFVGPLVLRSHACKSGGAEESTGELDAVVGPGRLPTFSDRDSLPYMNAIVLECLRWCPVVPAGIPHRAMADDEYNGYFIPKGSIIISNIWSFVRDASVYAQPEAFNPDRFLKDGKLDPEVTDPSTVAFGFGRRICPGRHLADDSLFIIAASVLHVYEINPGLDEKGRPVPFSPAMEPQAFSYPVPFKCRIKPRSETAEKLILATMDSQEEPIATSDFLL
ncbi:O-methylsterigmatocystin oxidoreductase [Grifola frondosa]|uniref:O-methylsterigmatocystin oxidoreductase n=1 Tax=Grifola frondosa TaxID=5627 RepID=A0A1C7LUT6_GRIFR|nr:O-methylsterigmatocystin oxidoreductase [Grifola frondosa]